MKLRTKNKIFLFPILFLYFFLLFHNHQIEASRVIRDFQGRPLLSSKREVIHSSQNFWLPATPLTYPQATIEAEIRAAANRAGLNPLKALAIAKCESNLNPLATNHQGSTAKGLFQFTDPTWKYIQAKGHQFDSLENIEQFMKWYPKHPEWWACDSLTPNF